MTTKSFYLAGFAMLFFSCSDDDNSDAVTNEDVSFSHFTVTSTTTNADGSLSPGNYSITENLVDQKRFSETVGGITTQRYFYSDGLIVQSPLGYLFSYDASGKIQRVSRMIKEGGVAVEVVYYFLHPQENVVYCERVVWANETSEILYRNILEFDADGNVVKAGPDQDLNGVMDHFNQFAYSNGDLVNIQFWNGSSQNFSYSGILDNFYFIDDNTYGKQVRRALCSEFYVGTNWETNLGHSKHLLASEPLESVFDLFDNGYYQKKTTTMQLEAGAQNEMVVKFFLN